MSERTNNVRFFLVSTVLGKEPIGEIENFEDSTGDTYSLQEEGHFEMERNSTVTLFQQGYEYLKTVRSIEGPSAKVQLIKEVKDDMTLEENWKVESDPHINMYSLSFNEEDDNLSVTCELIQGGDLKKIKSSFDDEFDITGIGMPELPFVNLRLDPLVIPKRTRFINSNIEVQARDDQGATARAVALELDYTSERQFIGEVSNTLANSSGGNYAKLTTSGNTIITNAPRELVYVLNGTVSIEIVNRALSGSFKMDLVRYSGGAERDFEEIILPLGNTDPTVLGGIISYTFTDYELLVNEGDSIGIMTLSDTSFGGSVILTYKTTEDTDLRLFSDTPFPTTRSKALKPFDFFKHMGSIVTEDPDYNFESSIFGPGGRHENKLMVHGTWLRNMPQTINEGEDDERRLQANISLEDLYGTYQILEPLRYDVIKYKGKSTFTVGAFRDIQQNFTGVRIGETRDKFRLIPVSSKTRDVIGDNYFRKIKLGSETSGSNYGSINNLFSICGYAEWNTQHAENDSEYEFTTNTRTGAEDIEVQRQFQYKDNPDIDGEADDDWFLVDAEFNGVEYVTKGWERYYDEEPTGVYSSETVYNWPFAPVELLRGHSYKISPALQQDLDGFLLNPRGNCNLSLKTRKVDEPEIVSNEPFPNSLLEKPRIKLDLLSFEVVMNQEIRDALRGQTQGVDNKAGLVEILYQGNIIKTRLFEAKLDKEASMKVIEAFI